MPQKVPQHNVSFAKIKKAAPVKELLRVTEIIMPPSRALFELNLVSGVALPQLQ